MSPPSILEILPVEIIDKILDEFCHHIRLLPCQTCLALDCCCNLIGTPGKPSYSPSVRALAILNRTCRPLHNLTTARLYSNPTAGEHISPMLLMRTLLARPDLARLVRSLRVRGCWKDVVSDEVVDYVVDKLIAKVQAWGVVPPSREYWRTQLTESDHLYCPTLEVLTSLCPNIEAVDGEDILPSLILDEPIFDRRHMAGMRPYEFPGDAFWTPGALVFSKLKTANLCHWDTEYTFDMSDFQGLLGCAASSLQSLGMVQLGGVDITRVPISLNEQGTVGATARLEGVTRLVIANSMIGFQDLVNLVELCPNVETFEYEAGGATLGDSCVQFGPQHAVDAAFGLRGGGKGWTRLRDVILGLWADEFRDEWNEDEIPIAKQMFAERGVKFTCEA